MTQENLLSRAFAIIQMPFKRVVDGDTVRVEVALSDSTDKVVFVFEEGRFRKIQIKEVRMMS